MWSARQVVLEREWCVAGRRIVEHAVFVLEQPLLQDVAALGRARADGQVAGAVAQHLQAGNRRRNHPQRHTGRRLAQSRRQRRQQHVALEIVGGDGHGGVPARRIESSGVGKALQLAQQFARLRGQFARARGGHDAAAALDEQRVAGDRAQLVQLVAHRPTA